MQLGEIKEYRGDGSLAYEETRIPAPIGARPEDVRINEDGTEWARTGRCAKYWPNGQLHWCINYDELGKAIRDDDYSRSYRADGSLIVR